MQQINWKSFLFWGRKKNLRRRRSISAKRPVPSVCACLFVWCVNSARVSARQCSLEPRKSTQAMLSFERRRCKWLFPVPFSQQQRTPQSSERHMKRNHCAMGFIVSKRASTLLRLRGETGKGHQKRIRHTCDSITFLRVSRVWRDSQESIDHWTVDFMRKTRLACMCMSVFTVERQTAS